MNLPSCPPTTTSPRRWTTCSSGLWHSTPSFQDDRTFVSDHASERASPWAANRGWFRAPIATANEPRSCSRRYREFNDADPQARLAGLLPWNWRLVRSDLGSDGPIGSGAAGRHVRSTAEGYLEPACATANFALLTINHQQFWMIEITDPAAYDTGGRNVAVGTAPLRARGSEVVRLYD